jgi:organic hydroperoxide reductase OsmC/OhrA
LTSSSRSRTRQPNSSSAPPGRPASSARSRSQPRTQRSTLPAAPAIDAEINLFTGAGGFFLRARLDVSVPGVDRELAEALVHAAHEICPYSKATRGNIDVTTNLV